MKKFLERYPWVQQAGCGVLICALLLSICLPLMGMRSAEPDNPILQAAPQKITVLQAGQAPGHAGNGEAESTGAAGSGGSTDSELTGEQEQMDPEETENQTEFSNFATLKTSFFLAGARKKRAEPVFPLRQIPQFVKFLLTRAIFCTFPSVKKHALRRVGVSFLFFIFPLFSIYSLS